MLVIVSDMAVGLLMEALTGIIRGVRTKIGVGMLMDVNANMFAGVMTTFEFAMPGPLEDFRR